MWAEAANKFPRWWIVVPYFVMFSTFLAVSVVDLRLFRIPDRILFPALAVTVPMVIVSTIVVQHGKGSIVEVLKHAGVGMVSYFAILFLFHLVSPRGMGFGDVKLALLMGIGLGWLGATVFNAFYMVLIALFLGCVFGIVFGLTMRLIKGRGGAFRSGPPLRCQPSTSSSPSTGT